MANDFSSGPLVIVSVGKRLNGESFGVNATDDTVVVSGLRMTFTLTVGFLAWELEDLDLIYHAQCDSETGCAGVRAGTAFLDQQSQVALVGQSELVQADLDALSTLLEMEFDYNIQDILWKKLVNIKSSSDILLPRNFKSVPDTVEPFLASRPTYECFQRIDKYIKTVEKNHLYAEESLQTGYTAGFHYLMQNAVLHTWSSSSGTLDLFGNYQDILVLASIPFINIVLSFGGCALLLAISFAVAVAHKHGKRVIEANSSVTVIAQAMLNQAKYPRSVLNLWLDKPGRDGSQPRRVKLDELEFETSVFGEKAKSSGEPLKRVISKLSLPKPLTSKKS